MNQSNFKGSTPFEKIPRKQYTSLEDLARRRKTVGSPVSKKHKHEGEQTIETLRRQVKRYAERRGNIAEKTAFEIGDVIGSLIIRDVTPSNYLICECTCGQVVKKTGATIKVVDVCRHAVNGRYGEEYRSKNHRRALFTAWKKMCEQNAEMNQSIYPPWQSFRRFVQDNLFAAQPKRSFTRVVPLEVSPQDTPECFAWLTVGQAKTISAVGLPVAYIDDKPVSLIRLALDLKVTLGYLTKHINNGITPNGIYDWLQTINESAETDHYKQKG